MLNRLLSDTYHRVCVTANEFRKTVHDNASRAKQLLRFIESGSNPTDFEGLQHILEMQAAEPTSLSQLHELYVRWLAHLTTTLPSSTSTAIDENDGEAIVYYKPPLKNGEGGEATFGMDFALTLFNSEPVESENVQDGSSSDTCLLQPAHGELTDSTVEEPVPLSKGAVNGIKGTTIALPLHPSSQEPAVLKPCENSLNVPPSSSSSTAEAASTVFSKTNPPSVLEVGYTWKEVFLHSQALEIALLSLAQLRDVREILAAPLEDDNIETSTRGVLQRIMSITMRGDPKTHQELLFLFCTVDLKSETWRLQLKHLVELVSILKYDFETEHLKTLRHCARKEIDSILSSLRPGRVASPPLAHSEALSISSGSDTPTKAEGLLSAAHPKAVAGAEPSISTTLHATTELNSLITKTQNAKQLLDLCATLTALSEREIERRRQVETQAVSRLTALQRSVDHLSEKFSSLGGQAMDKRDSVAAERRAAIQALEEQLEAASALKTSTSAAVKQLEVQRQELLTALAAIEERLAVTKMQEQTALRTFERLSRKWDGIVRMYDQRESRATEIEHQSVLYHLDMQNTRLLVIQSGTFFGNNVPPDASAEDNDLCHQKSFGNDITFLSLPIAVEQFFSAQLTLLEMQLDHIGVLGSHIEAVTTSTQCHEDPENSLTTDTSSNQSASSTTVRDRDISEQNGSKSLDSFSTEPIDKIMKTELKILRLQQLETQLLGAVRRLERLWQEVVAFQENITQHLKTLGVIDDLASKSVDVTGDSGGNHKTGRTNDISYLEACDKDGFVDAGVESVSAFSEETSTTTAAAAVSTGLSKTVREYVSRAEAVYVAAKEVATVHFGRLSPNSVASRNP